MQRNRGRAGRLTTIMAMLLCASGMYSQDSSALKREFLHPGKQYRPMVRWWWPGDAVTDAEITREIDLLDSAWFGGAEVQPFTLYFQNGLSAEDKKKVSLGFGTPSFFGHVRKAIDVAHDHGMWIDDTFGSGWPSGGGLAITPELASVELRYADTVVTGPSSVPVKAVVPEWKPDMMASMTRAKGYFPDGWQQRLDARTKTVAVVAIRGREVASTATAKTPEILDEASTVVVTDKLQADGTLDWSVPAGRWHIFVFRQIPTRQLVVNGSGAGPQLVLDHFNRAAFDAHAAHVGEPLVAAAGPYAGNTLRAVFVDSLEVMQYLAWSDDLLAQFRQRRGYDLTPYLPILRVAGYNDQNDSVPGGLPFFDVAGGDAIRKDYWQTVSELITERFYQPFDQWAKQHKLQSRVQAHGAPADILSIYGQAGIPETEELGGNNTVNFMKLASSAGYDYGRPIVSSESFVFHGNPNVSTPQSIKANADKMLISGVNEIIYHGFPYKFDTGIAGVGWFPFRAVSTPVLESNPIWPYLAKVNQYITRLQYVAQKGASDLQVAVFRSSLNDDDTGPSPAAGALQDSLPGIEQELTSAGYSFGFVNGPALIGIRAKDGTFTTRGGGRYKALVVPHPSRVSPETIPLLQALIAAHVPVVFAGDLPGEDVGFLKMAADRTKVADGLRRLAGSSVIKVQETKDIGSQLSKLVPPQVRFVSGATLPFLKKTIASTSFYLLTNPSDQATHTTIELTERRTPETWDPWSGDVSVAAAHRSATGVSIDVGLPPYGSQLLVFGAGSATPHTTPAWTQWKEQEVGAAGWSIDATGNSDKGVHVSLHVDMSKLVDWLDEPALRLFSGAASYTTHVSVTAQDLTSAGRILLDLGTVRDAATVSVNGRAARQFVVQPFALDIKPLLHAGENEVRITVSNTNTNYVSSLKGSAVGTYQTGHFDPLSSGLLGPVRLQYKSNSPAH